MNSRIALAALAALLLTAPAQAAHHRTAQSTVTQFCGDRACPTYAIQSHEAHYALRQPRQDRAEAPRTRHHSAERRHARPGPRQARTLAGYAAESGPIPSAAEASARGLVTIDVAGGHRITVSLALAGPITGLIADLYAHGQRFTRIKCWARRGEGHHVRNSNHWPGDACDFFGEHPIAALVRAHGLRSGRDFADAMHVDNAKNVGGVAFWNSVKHGHRRTVRVARR